jgi:hypothetical protein
MDLQSTVERLVDACLWGIRWFRGHQIMLRPPGRPGEFKNEQQLMVSVDAMPGPCLVFSFPVACPLQSRRLLSMGGPRPPIRFHS